MKRSLVSGLMAAILAGSLVTPAFAAPNQSTVYSKPVSGKCVDGAVKLKIKKTAKVNWEWANGNVGKKTLKKGKTVCQYVSSAGVTTEATYVDGVLTALPKNFPKNPTVQDIQSLGLTADSKVSPKLKIPQPTGKPLVEGSLPSAVKPVSVSRPFNVYQVDEWGDVTDRQMFNVTWNLAGGSGIIHYTKYDPATNTYVQTYTPLSPNGVTQIVSTDWSEGSEEPSLRLSGRVESNFGQANLPSSAISNTETGGGWDVPNVKDKSGVGSPTGVNSNPGGDYNPNADGIVLLDKNNNMMMLDY